MHIRNRNFKLRYLRLLAAAFALLAASFSLSACQNGSAQPEAPSVPTRATASPKTNAPTTATLDDTTPTIVAFGDSLTAGYGLSADESYTTLLQRKLDAAGYKYRVVNAGVSGDTSAGGLARIDWSLEGNVKFLILELGANDGLRGLPVAAMKKNLAEIIKRAQARGVTVLLAGMEAPPNMGAEYTRQFRQAFADLAREYKVAFIPFVLQGVGGLAEYNQADGIHPNAKGEQVMTDTVWRTLRPMLQ